MGLGPLRSLVRFALVVLAACSMSRLVLAASHLDRIHAVPEAWRLLPIGVRFDTMMLGPALMPAALAVLLWPTRHRRMLARFVATYLAALAAVMTFLEIATIGFLAQYDSRPNRIFLDYLAYPAEVLPTVWGEQLTLLIVGLWMVPLAAVVTWRAIRPGIEADVPWSARARVLALPLVGLVLFALARSSLAPRPADISAAAFTADHLTNELALNSTYAVGYALCERRHELDPGTLYRERRYRLPATRTALRSRERRGG